LPAKSAAPLFLGFGFSSASSFYSSLKDKIKESAKNAAEDEVGGGSEKAEKVVPVVPVVAVKALSQKKESSPIKEE
jgi:hypothetical protein